MNCLGLILELFSYKLTNKLLNTLRTSKRTSQMDILKQRINEYVEVKEELKKQGDRKKLLEKIICTIMSERNISTVELPDGMNINYLVKDALTVSKEKGKKKDE